MEAVERSGDAMSHEPSVKGASPDVAEPGPPPTADPQGMKDYYENHPQPPPPEDKPQRPEKPGEEATEEELEAYEEALDQYRKDIREGRRRIARYLAAKHEYEEEFGPPPEPEPIEVPAVPGVPAGAGFPAARIGDMTVHGGVITVGCPQVLIGGMPAARVTDMHTCPMVNGVVPHVGGPVLPPCSMGVVIAGVPAARMTDQATCTGPPDIIAMGDFTTLIG